MEKYILTISSGKGFITHEDQEQDGLKFRCLAGDIVKVTGEEDKVLKWVERTEGDEMTKDDASVIVDGKEKANKQKRIKDLKAELVTLEKNVQ